MQEGLPALLAGCGWLWLAVAPSLLHFFQRQAHSLVSRVVTSSCSPPHSLFWKEPSQSSPPLTKMIPQTRTSTCCSAFPFASKQLVELSHQAFSSYESLQTTLTAPVHVHFRGRRSPQASQSGSSLHCAPCLGTTSLRTNFKETNLLCIEAPGFVICSLW